MISSVGSRPPYATSVGLSATSVAASAVVAKKPAPPPNSAPNPSFVSPLPVLLKISLFCCSSSKNSDACLRASCAVCGISSCGVSVKSKSLSGEVTTGSGITEGFEGASGVSNSLITSCTELSTFNSGFIFLCII